MREIKFRGQTVDTKELIYGNLIQTEKGFKNVVEILDWSKVGCKPEKSLVVNPETVSEFTGLTDKKGVEIYENDILKSELDWIFVVKWDKENARFIGFSPTNQIIYVGREPKATVIGNIFDNPELMQ